MRTFTELTVSKTPLNDLIILAQEREQYGKGSTPNNTESEVEKNLTEIQDSCKRSKTYKSATFDIVGCDSDSGHDLADILSCQIYRGKKKVHSFRCEEDMAKSWQPQYRILFKDCTMTSGPVKHALEALDMATHLEPIKRALKQKKVYRWSEDEDQSSSGIPSKGSL